MFDGQLTDAALRGVDAHQQFVEREVAVQDHYDLAVERELLRLQRAESIHELWEIACQRLGRLRLQVHSIAVAERQTSEPVPLGLVLPSGAGGDLVPRGRFHREIRL